MNLLYNKLSVGMISILAFTTVAYGQNAKVKTITIVNGDTTVSESNMDEKEMEKIEKEINITITDDGKSEKKIVKKIIINGDKDSDAEAMAYSFSTDDGDKKEKKTVVKKMDVTKDDADLTEENSMKLNINVKNTIAKVEIETGSKEPLNISVLDENGKQVFYDSQKTGGKYSKEIPLGKKGTYFMNIIQNKKASTEKIIVE